MNVQSVTGLIEEERPFLVTTDQTQPGHIERIGINVKSREGGNGVSFGGVFLQEYWVRYGVQEYWNIVIGVFETDLDRGGSRQRRYPQVLNLYGQYIL